MQTSLRMPQQLHPGNFFSDL